MSNKGKKVQKAVVYKRTEFHVKRAGESLKTLMDAALKKNDTVGSRRRNVSGDSENPVWQLIGASTSEVDGFAFGILMTYSPGLDPLFLTDDSSAAKITLEKLAAPLKNGKRRELLESVLFFGAIRNHVVLMQSQALKAAQFESYLQWFLNDAKVLAGDNTLQLLDTPTQAIKDRVENGNGVRSIKLGSEMLPSSQMRSVGITSERSSTKSVSVTAGRSESNWGALEAVKKLLEPSTAAKIDFEQLAGSNIELTVTLRYTNKTTEDGHKLMDTLGAAFRNTEEVDAEIELIDGTKINGADLKLHGKVSVTSYDGQLSETEVNEAMRVWLLTKIKDQDIAAV